jgi:hypothetical protein
MRAHEVEKNVLGLTSLKSASLPLKVLFTGYLIVMGVGLLMSGMQILLTHGMADGEFGLSVDDIVYSYYGNRGNSKLEGKLNGTMKDKASYHDRAALIKWVQGGSSRSEWDQNIQPIVNSNCVKCHGTVPGLASFTTYEGITAYTEIDTGASIDSLTRVSHIHLFGIAFIFFFVCLIFSLATGIPVALKATVIGFPFVFLIVDILCWWLVKWFPVFARVEIAAGIGMNLCAGFMILVSLFQMWVLQHRRVPNEQK